MPDPSKNVASTTGAPRLLILGGSTRSAAHSAVRAGFQPICGDVFADFDLRTVAETLKIADYPEGLVAAAQAAPPAPWMYTGALENHPGIVERISAGRTLWGNGPDVLKQVRDPMNVAAVLHEVGLPCPEVRPQERPPDADGTWLIKPLGGAAGRGIRVWDETGRGRPDAAEVPSYFQKRCNGRPCSAVFCGSATETLFAGTTEQLIGVAEVHAPRFAWCGSIVPVDLPAGTADAMRRIGQVLGTRLGLRGLFGCDFIVEDETPWLTEINPRYTGSMELFEHRDGVALLDWHARACDPAWAAARGPKPEMRAGQARQPAASGNRPVLGKIVLYAETEVVVGDARHLLVDPREHRLPEVADLPAPGDPIRRGKPICTLFASAASRDECLARLLESSERFASEFVHRA